MIAKSDGYSTQEIALGPAKWVWINKRSLLGPCLLVLTVCIALSGCGGAQKFNAEQSMVIKSAEQAGATDLESKHTDDGGLLLGGKLDGRQFALAIPLHWNRQASLFAHGYSFPGSSIDVASNPLKDDPLGLYRTPYSQGFAVGHSAFDKAGMGVESGVKNTYSLRQFVGHLGATRVYAIGGSMGGNITMGLIEKYPGSFAGAMTACGVVDSWTTQLQHMIDQRAAYNYFTRGTKYALPGEQSITRSALPTHHFAVKVAQYIQLKRVTGPVLDLFAAAKADPKGPEKRIIENVASASDTPEDPAAFAVTLFTIALGMDDMNETFGGEVYDNSSKVYHSSYLTDAENAKLNAGIERVHSDPAAVAKADLWYKTSGKFDAKLLSIYNDVDPLVPSDINESGLRNAVVKAGNTGNLIQRSVPAMSGDIPTSNVKGYVHCGFTEQQIASAWNDLHHWVETGKKP